MTILVSWTNDQKARYKDTNWEEEKLPGLNFTPKQLFWISWGQIWCAKFRDGFLKKMISVGAHPPDGFRINGPLSNNEAFAKDFKCPRGSAMNPKKKCVVW